MPGIRKHGHAKTITKLNRQQLFLDAYSQTSLINKSCEAAGITKYTVFLWNRDDLDFKKRYDDAEIVVGNNLEDEARRRACEGVERTVYQGGRDVGKFREYSDGLLRFLIRGAKPEKYADRTKQEIAITDDVDLRHIDTSDLIRLVNEERKKRGL